ncbi:uncharacterized protein LOC130759104 isoform X2 [Actinidia eriantha]|uniref:uncharacterized protein LOC130759104 isoform X1 n=1 Tax=Actinidia eriantha TaxID=165200 RepID=UPI00258BFEFB|nr:uncharacterized protein LOC130759104 isoform X1 [Actinidia eriantha]XP_057470186.1 uncharacterized protein LOC130759104 isoform X1 [Actinidia eriantha]XP_057470187.1 uncharacterized protein LOC130759104 isoform X2 [Actinidia eriantha]
MTNRTTDSFQGEGGHPHRHGPPDHLHSRTGNKVFKSVLLFYHPKVGFTSSLRLSYAEKENRRLQGSWNAGTQFFSLWLVIGIGWTSRKKRWFILTRTSLVFFRSDPAHTMYGGPMPKKPLLIPKDHERAYFNSSYWALGETQRTISRPFTKIAANPISKRLLTAWYQSSDP